MISNTDPKLLDGAGASLNVTRSREAACFFVMT